MLWGHSWLIDKIWNISWHVILQVCPRYKIVVVVGHNGVKSLPEVASKMSSNTKVEVLWEGHTNFEKSLPYFRE